MTKLINPADLRALADEMERGEFDPNTMFHDFCEMNATALDFRRKATERGWEFSVCYTVITDDAAAFSEVLKAARGVNWTK